MPGFCGHRGLRPRATRSAVKIVRELQKRNILCFLSRQRQRPQHHPPVAGRGRRAGLRHLHRALRHGHHLAPSTRWASPPARPSPSAACTAGQARNILLYNKDRVFAFVLALGEVDDLKYAAAAGAINFGFPVIADTRHPADPADRRLAPTSTSSACRSTRSPARRHWSAPRSWSSAASRCAASRSRSPRCPIPVPYGSAFEGERIRKDDMHVEFGGKQLARLRVPPHGRAGRGRGRQDRGHRPGLRRRARGRRDALGIVVEVAGRKMQADFEPVLERQIHHLVNGAEGIQHMGQRDIAWIRISKNAFDKGFGLRALRRDPPRQAPRRVRRHRRQGAGHVYHRRRPRSSERLGHGPRGLRRAQRAPGAT